MWFDLASAEAEAPDQASLKAARGLAKTSRWPELGSDDFVIWGQCQGSGANPYQAAVDSRDLGCRCSCPSRKFPCKHSLALMLIAAGQPEAITAGAAPEWVTLWLGRRRGRKNAPTGTPSGGELGSPGGGTAPSTMPSAASGAPSPSQAPPASQAPLTSQPPVASQGTMPSAASGPPSPSQAPPAQDRTHRPRGGVDPQSSPAFRDSPGLEPELGQRPEPGAALEASAASTEAVAKKAARDAARQAAARQNVSDGLDELEDWIADQLRLGLSRLIAEAGDQCRRIAARLVDHKAAALASRLDEMPARLAALPPPERPHQAVRELGKLVALIRAWRTDPDAPQVKRAVTQAESRTDLLDNPAALRVVSLWEVAGSRVATRRDRLISQATWLVNLGQGPPFGLLQDYYPAAVGASVSPMPSGLQIAAELVYYPGGEPTRAVIAVQEPVPERLPWPGATAPGQGNPGEGRNGRSDETLKVDGALAGLSQTRPARAQNNGGDAAGVAAPGTDGVPGDLAPVPAAAGAAAALADSSAEPRLSADPLVDPLASCRQRWDSTPWELETPVLLGPAEVLADGSDGQRWWAGGQVALPLANAIPAPLVGSALEGFAVWDGARLDVLSLQSQFGPVWL